jgi:cyclopropane-fatty-acyl-phospholipid synthase
MTRLEKMIVHIGSGDLGKLAGLPAGFRLAAMILVRLKKGRLDVTFPDGRSFRFEGPEPGPQGEIIVRDASFVGRVLARGDIGFAEAFMHEQFDTPCLPDVLEYFTRNFESAGRLAVGGWMAQWINAFHHRRNQNSRRGSRRNILAHYDLGNAFYELWLDPSMTYSSAIFSRPDQTLEEAQYAKYRAIAGELNLKPGMRVLEIGSGWGGFAEVAAREFGARVDSVTISDAQHAYARQRIERAGLSDLVDIQLKDYRDVAGTYDAVASIEMFEAVGEKYWSTYFGKIAEVLRPGGRASLQIITIDDKEFDFYRTRVDFIQMYIFPGGMLPSIARLREETSQVGLGLSVAEMFGASYARTLAEWGERFEAAWETIRPMGFDERFRRMWLYYLAYCQAGFRTGRIDVGRFVLTKPV